jgi:hypothetical protein
VPEGTPSHANGGIDMNLPQGTEILGKLKNSNDKRYKDLGQRMEKAYDKYKKVIEGTPTPIAKRTAEKNLEKLQREYTQLMQEQESQKGEALDTGEEETYAVGGLTGSQIGMINDTYDMAQNQSQQAPGMGAAGWASVAAQAAPALYNIGQGIFGSTESYSPDDFMAKNPYQNQAIQAMQDREYNAQPELRRAEMAAANREKTIEEMAQTPGQYLTNQAISESSRRKTIADIMARKQQAENQYASQEAQMMSQLGSQEAQRQSAANQQALQMNARTQANKQRMLSRGLGQLGQTAAGVSRDLSSARNTQMLADAYNQYLRDYNINLTGSSDNTFELTPIERMLFSRQNRQGQ